jgi:pimeloyl-ACP methyl ester carboxylesterase
VNEYPDSQCLHAGGQGSGLDAERDRGGRVPGDSAVGELERLPDVGPVALQPLRFRVRKRRRLFGRRLIPGAGLVAHRGLQIEVQALLAADDDRPLDDVLQLADVAGPVLGLKPLDIGLGEVRLRPVHAAADQGDEMGRQRRDIGATLAQRQRLNGKHVILKYWKKRTPENARALAGFIAPEGVKWQYTHGVRNEAAIRPDNWNVDLRHLTREGNPHIQLALFYDYQNNVPHYPAWQAYFRKHQPPTLIVWGKNDYIFPAEGAHSYTRDLKNPELHLLDTGHFALEEDGQVITDYIRELLTTRIASRQIEGD